MCLQINKPRFSKTRDYITFLEDFGLRYVHHFKYTFRPCHEQTEGLTFHGDTEQNSEVISDMV